MDKELRILILDDVGADAELEEYALLDAGLVFTSKVVDQEADFVKALDEFLPDIILSDYDLPTFNGLEALEIAKGKVSGCAFYTGYREGREEFAIETLKKGVTDYVMKGNIERLVPSINRALEETSLIKDRKQGEKKLIMNNSNSCKRYWIQSPILFFTRMLRGNIWDAMRRLNCLQAEKRKN